MFRFKLEFLLRYRRQKEELAMFELAERVRKANEIENYILDLQERAEELVASVRGLDGNIIPSSKFTMYSEHREYLREEEKRTRHYLLQAEAAVEQQRQKLVEISVQRKIIERYKEKQKADYDKTAAGLEQKNLDELAALAAVRKTHEAS
ncbi:MAG: flagellar export protein FliJ [Deltaproteobacteria bacterium]|nr:flagellar export protein FliJ [Deltaproteobacteria bacterium]